MPKKASKSDQKGGQTSSKVGSVTGPSTDAYEDYDPTETRSKDPSSSASVQKSKQSGSGKKSGREPTDHVSKDAYEDDYDPTDK